MRQWYRFAILLSSLALLLAASCTGELLKLPPLPEPIALGPTATTADTAGPTPVDTLTPTPTGTPDLPARLSVPTLMYHHIQVLGRKNNTATWRNVTVTPKDFEEQVAYLASHNYHTISFGELISAFQEGRPLPENPVILTFDDAWEEQYTVAYPLLLQYGLKGTFFVPTNFMEHVKGALTWDQIQEMSGNGMEFGSHSITHPFLTRQNPAAVKRELETSKADLEEHLGQTVVAFAYPFGAYNAPVMGQVQDAGYRAAVTIQPGEWAEKDKLLALHRTGIPYGLSLKNFERVLQRLTAKEPTEVATPGIIEVVSAVTPADMEGMPATPVPSDRSTPEILSAPSEVTPESTAGSQ